MGVFCLNYSDIGLLLNLVPSLIQSDSGSLVFLFSRDHDGAYLLGKFHGSDLILPIQGTSLQFQFSNSGFSQGRANIHRVISATSTMPGGLRDSNEWVDRKHTMPTKEKGFLLYGGILVNQLCTPEAFSDHPGICFCLSPSPFPASG